MAIAATVRADAPEPTSSSYFTVVLVEDHELTRIGIKQILQWNDDMRVVGEAAGGDEAISIIAEHQPDVVVLDIRLQQGSAMDVLAASKELAPGTKILILSAHDDVQYVRRFMALGAHEYLVKTISAESLTGAVRDVARGEPVFPQRLLEKVIPLVQSVEATYGSRGVFQSLTRREAEVAERVVEGLTNAQIAKTLGIALKTVETHVKRILFKLGATNRTQAVVSILKDQTVAERG